MAPTPKPTHKQEALAAWTLAWEKVLSLPTSPVARYLKADLETLRERLDAIEELKQKRSVKKVAVTP